MLPQEFRLTKRGDFSRVYARGKAIACKDFVMYRCKRRGGAVRIGFSSSKKLGGAVQRNRARRVFRHAAAGILDKFPAGADYVFIIRASGAVKTAPQIQRSILRQLTEGESGR